MVIELKERAPRVRFKHPVRVVPLDGSPRIYRTLAANLSRRGMFVRMPEPLPRGTKVALSLEAGGQALPFAEAEIAWCRVSDPQLPGRYTGFGVRFTSFLNPRAPELVEYLVKNLDRGRPLKVAPSRAQRFRWRIAGLSAAVLAAVALFAFVARSSGAASEDSDSVAAAALAADDLPSAPAPVAPPSGEVGAAVPNPGPTPVVGRPPAAEAAPAPVSAPDPEAASERATAAQAPAAEAEPKRVTAAPPPAAELAPAPVPAPAPEAEPRRVTDALPAAAEPAPAPVPEASPKRVMAAPPPAAAPAPASASSPAREPASVRVAAASASPPAVTPESVRQPEAGPAPVHAAAASARPSAERPDAKPAPAKSDRVGSAHGRLALSSGAAASLSWDARADSVLVKLDLAPGATMAKRFLLAGPPRLVLDLDGKAPKKSFSVDGKGDWLSQVRVGRHGSSTRVVIDLTQPPASMTQADDGVTLTFAR